MESRNIKYSFLQFSHIQNISATKCKQSNCCYATENGCFHALPSRHQYQIKDKWEGNSAYLEPLQNVTPFNGNATQQLKVTIEEVDQHCLTISLVDSTKVPVTVSLNNYFRKNWLYKKIILYRPLKP
jgi:hypothetical protein